jgi:hypothetical protein
MFSNLESKVSFTTDCWTSPNNFGFMGITAHWVDSTIPLCHTTLAFAPLAGNHGGLELAMAFKDLIREFQLTTKYWA